MRTVDLCLHPQWIIPIEPSNTIHHNYSLAIENEKILDILTTTECETQYLPKKTINLPNHIIMPGLINSHTHLPMNLFRGLADDLPLQKWLTQYIWPAEKQFVNEEFINLGSKLAIAECLKGGITCFNDMYFFPELIANNVVAAGIRAAASIHIMDTPCPWGNNLDDYWRKGDNFYHLYHDHPLITPTIATHAPYTVSNATLRETLQKQKHYQCKLNIHLHETQNEIEQSLIDYKQRPLRRLETLNILSPDLIGIHMVHLNQEDLSIAKDTGIHIVTCPESNLKLASGICPVSQLLNQKTNVAIGTDSAASNNDLDMFAETRLTALLAKTVAQQPTACPAYTALTMATLNGAKALGIEQQTGSIKIGKMADLIAVDFSDINSLPMYSAPSQIAYATERAQVTDVWVHGKQLVKEKKLLTLDENQIKIEVLDYQKRIQKNIHRTTSSNISDNKSAKKESNMNNVDENEVKKFSHHAKRWWDKNGPLETLHQINPLRLKFIQREVPLRQQLILDVGCGGGILTESLAKLNAKVTGIDQSYELIQIAKLHQKTSNLNINYHQTSIEKFRQKNTQKFDIITCLELLEHVPSPQQLLADSIHLLKPEGSLFVSTINRTPKAFALAIVAAEYILRLLPQGTHNYKKLIKPAEIAAWGRQNQCDTINVTGMGYNPLQQTFYLTKNTSMLYTMHLKKRAHS